MSQEQDESFDQFLNRLRELAATCNFGTLEEEMIRDRIVIGIRDNRTRERLLREPDLKLERAIDTCRTNELATKQRQKMEKTEIDNYIRAKQRPSNSCQYCGGVHVRGNCPAYGKTCTACKKKNHLVSVCKTKRMTKHSGGSLRDDKSKPPRDRKLGQHIHQLEDHDPEEHQAELSSDDRIYHLHSTNSKAQYFTEVEVAALKSRKSAQVKFQLDTGTTCSTTSLEDYSRIRNQAPQQSQAKLKLYDNSIIHPIGSVKLHLTANGIKKKIHFEVIRDDPTSLLSGKACEALGLLHFNEECVMRITTTTPSLTKGQILHEYKDIFTGLGKLPGTYHIETNPTVKPVQNNPR